jgi:L-ascorbate metabolism protein UlaG (beta-lactamase superfamily)
VAEVALQFVGHSTVLMDFGGRRLITDPVLRGRIGYLSRIAPPVELRPLRQVDAILVSHVHHDHLDGPSLKLLGADRRVVAPRGAGRLLRAKGIRDVVECEPGDTLEVAGVRVTATEADHHAPRLPWHTPVPALGFVVDGGPKVYFAGDTDLFDGMRAIGDLGLDVAFVPVAGWGPRTPPGHMNPTSAAQSLALLRPAVAVPIHWGTISAIWARRTAQAGRRAPPERFADEASRTAPEVNVQILEPGESLRIPAPERAGHGSAG